MKPIKIILNEENFRNLVAGKVVETTGTEHLAANFVSDTGPVEIILQDIGWDRMIQAIKDSVAK